ncbi:MAG: hypothetical protein AAGA20_24175, partial [Planctomycetota bacterium]
MLASPLRALPWIAASALAVAAASVDDGPWLELPDDPLGRLWASVGRATEPWSPPDADSDGLWMRWSRALAALDEPAERRGALHDLAEIALQDGRIEDAYRWVLAFGADDPEALAGAVPRLFPGVDAGVHLGPGGRAAGLSDGATLRPQLPPRSSDALPDAIDPRRATARGLVVGEATIDMELRVDGSGIVCELAHASGGAAELELYLPAPDGFRLSSAYIDWEIQDPPEGSDPETIDWRDVPLRLVLEPREDPLTVFARIRRAPFRFPTPPDRSAA